MNPLNRELVGLLGSVLGPQLSQQALLRRWNSNPAIISLLISQLISLCLSLLSIRKWLFHSRR